MQRAEKGVSGLKIIKFWSFGMRSPAQSAIPAHSPRAFKNEVNEQKGLNKM